MTTAYHQLYFGLIGAIVPVYLVIVVNFLSWLRTAKPIDDLEGLFAFGNSVIVVRRRHCEPLQVESSSVHANRFRPVRFISWSFEPSVSAQLFGRPHIEFGLEAILEAVCWERNVWTQRGCCTARP
jgi:hypothetical protein